MISRFDRPEVSQPPTLGAGGLADGTLYEATLYGRLANLPTFAAGRCRRTALPFSSLDLFFWLERLAKDIKLSSNLPRINNLQSANLAANPEG